MTTLHPDAAIIERIGPDIVKEHFAMTRTTLWAWRRKGVPEGSRRPLALLGETRGVDVSDFVTSA